MGLPWPPVWHEGAQCARCDAALFSNRSPAFVYAQCTGIGKCIYTDPLAPDPNRVIRMIQSIPAPCFWSGAFHEGIYAYSYGWTLDMWGSSFGILDISGMWIFRSTTPVQCVDQFANELVCGPPFFPGFSGGNVVCFW